MNIFKCAFALLLCLMALLVVSQQPALAGSSDDCNTICLAEPAPGGWCNGYCAPVNGGHYCHCAGNDACFDPNFMIADQDPCLNYVN
jgi:hypothetical protein